MALEEYRRKRDFKKTPEPAGAPRPAGAGAGGFVIQKHAARRLHYDFRLELDGVLKSWAVTKGPSYNPSDKRLAVMTEDHPIEYGEFEGTIPQGEYGGGTVLLWDHGTWTPLVDPHQGLKKGHLKFRLDGAKMKGGWALIRMPPRDNEKRENWLLIKERDDFAAARDVCAEEPLSVVSGRDIDQIAGDQDRTWHSRRGRIDVKALPGARPGALPERIEPQLATLAPEAPDGEEWLHEIKFDGYRAICRIDKGKARFLTRHGLDWTDKFRPLAEAVRRVPVNTAAMLDGEVVVLNGHGASDFQALQEALSDGAGERLVYYVFDLLHLDGCDLSGVALEKRKEVLKELLAELDGPVRYSDHFDGRGPEVRERACSFALEGVVSKRRDRPFRAGRGRDWIKTKCLSRQEFVVVGHTPPQGERKGLGALLLAYNDGGRLVYAGKVGTGFSEKTLAELLKKLEPTRVDKSALADPPKEKGAIWVEPRLVAEVEFSQWTRDGLLRHPSFLGLRLDKEPGEVVREAATVQVPLRPGLKRQLDAVRLTSPDKVLYGQQGITKKGLATYYLEVADRMLPHVAGRMLTLVRCPQGHGKECFYQRHAGTGLPAGIKKQLVKEREQVEPYVYIEDAEGLLGLVQVGTLEIHTWGSRVEDTEHPDMAVFDLDPDPDLPWPRVVEGAKEVRAFLEDELGLKSFVKTTGGKGLHVVAPLQPADDWDTIKALTKAVVTEIAAAAPERYTANMAKAKRRGRIFLDYLRNQRTATFIAPYSTRARPGAPVAVPLAWPELDTGLRSDYFTVETILRRLAGQKRDPWADFFKIRQRFDAKARKRLKI
jgi:bifunctional non-homologous end joining protein LigD